VVDLIESFAIDKTEVEFTAYEKCVQTKICSAPMHEWNKKNYPVTGISAKSADVYCRWNKKRLPTEREWIFAVRKAQDNRIYPWGDRAPKRGQANLGAWANEASTDAADGYRYVAPVTSFKSGSNGAGVINLVGNVQEFVVLDKEFTYVAKGGGYLSLGFEGRVTAKRKVSPDQTATDLGFRCARSL
jgi:formylglycine-generating enzyme required for sulfatase activity